MLIIVTFVMERMDVDDCFTNVVGTYGRYQILLTLTFGNYWVRVLLELRNIFLFWLNTVVDIANYLINGHQYQYLGKCFLLAVNISGAPKGRLVGQPPPF